MDINDKFKEQIQKILPTEWEALLNALQTEPSVSVRKNIYKNIGNISGNQVPWCDLGHYLNERAPFTFDPMFHAGAYYVQDASSMFIHHILKQIVGDKDINYLDLCAAPGGKTTTALNALSEKSLVVCNEIDRQRAQILRENIIKWGAPNCVVCNDTSNTLGKLKYFFDVIAADMPCSGEGMFRKDAEAVAQWSPALVEQCAERQQEILDNIWKALKPGGFFIYSTCTFNRQENEEMVNYIIDNYDAESIEIQTEDNWNIAKGIDTPYHCYRFMPHRTNGEGLFVAVLQKAGNPTDTKIKSNKKKSKNQPVSKDSKALIKTPENFEFVSDGEMIKAYVKDQAERIKYIEEQARVIYSGIEIATIKGKDIIPEHSLAMSIYANFANLKCCDVEYAQAIQFLRGESFPLNNLGNGHIVITYKNIPLGFMKNIGQRANNRYPKEWRIKSSFVPETAPIIVEDK